MAVDVVVVTSMVTSKAKVQSELSSKLIAGNMDRIKMNLKM